MSDMMVTIERTKRHRTVREMASITAGMIWLLLMIGLATYCSMLEPEPAATVNDAAQELMEAQSWGRHYGGRGQFAATRNYDNQNQPTPWRR